MLLVEPLQPRLRPKSEYNKTMAKQGSATFAVYAGIALLFALYMVATRNTQSNQ